MYYSRQLRIIVYIYLYIYLFVIYLYDSNWLLEFSNLAKNRNLIMIILKYIVQNFDIYLNMIAFNWHLGIYNCYKKLTEKSRKVIWLFCHYFENLTCSKLPKNQQFLCDYFKIVQNVDIYLNMNASNWHLGIYNCSKNLTEKSRKVIWPFFHYFGN